MLFAEALLTAARAELVEHGRALSLSQGHEKAVGILNAPDRRVRRYRGRRIL